MNRNANQTNDVFYKRLMWDYNIPAEDVRAVLWGEKQKAGHYDAHGLFKKAIESFSWYIIKDIIPLSRTKELLRGIDLTTLKDEGLATRYGYIKRKLEELL